MQPGTPSTSAADGAQDNDIRAWSCRRAAAIVFLQVVVARMPYLNCLLFIAMGVCGTRQPIHDILDSLIQMHNQFKMELYFHITYAN
jgi:hypothetical protein